VTSSRVFTSNRAQAAPVPKAVAFADDVKRVDILKVGHSRIILPQGRWWDDFFDNSPRGGEDFMMDRVQPMAEERDSFGSSPACRTQPSAFT